MMDLSTTRMGTVKHGCAHYRRSCALVAPCCNEVFTCRFCHDEKYADDYKNPKKMHSLDRFAVTELQCLVCDVRQPLSESCKNCGVCFGNYSCMTCRLFDDDTSKEQFHCNECGICRVGGRENYEHCVKCGTCFTTDGEHNCIENAMLSNCPICMDELFYSRKEVASMRCGHGIHKDCLEKLLETTYKCPLCSKSLVQDKYLSDYFTRLDQEILRTPMPVEYRDKMVEVLCYDCNRKSMTQWHVVGLKCMALLSDRQSSDIEYTESKQSELPEINETSSSEIISDQFRNMTDSEQIETNREQQYITVARDAANAAISVGFGNSTPSLEVTVAAASVVGGGDSNSSSPIENRRPSLIRTAIAAQESNRRPSLIRTAIAAHESRPPVSNHLSRRTHPNRCGSYNTCRTK
eukprot:GSMAST32.ASY1.ANO1.2004.1 assembled CDS